MLRTFLRSFSYSFAWDLGRYVVVAGLAFLVFRVILKERLRRKLIQPDYAPASDVRREVLWSLSTAVVFALTGACLWCGSRVGVFRIDTRIAQHGWLWFWITVVALPVLHDTWFYWTHRAMHHRWLFRRAHLVHHLSKRPSPAAAYAFAPLEAVIQAAFIPVVALFWPIHVMALFVFLGFMIARNVYGHLGVELLPRAFVRHPWLRWSTTTTHHDMHHEKMNGNYGLYFTFWDRAMGTMHADYEERFERSASECRSRDSLLQRVHAGASKG
jgi:sterol desaturase/sphingolipid hydroxylase (fatty acid hydroxylase superfamily)